MADAAATREREIGEIGEKQTTPRALRRRSHQQTTNNKQQTTINNAPSHLYRVYRTQLKKPYQESAQHSNQASLWLEV